MVDRSRTPHDNFALQQAHDCLRFNGAAAGAKTDLSQQKTSTPPPWAPRPRISQAGVSVVVGTGVRASVTVTAGVMISMAIDHFGVFGVDTHLVSLWPLVGVMLMIGAVALVAAF